MRLVVATGPGVVELNFMWLPTFIGLDTILKKRIEDEVAPLLVGKDLTEELLEDAHEKVLDVLCERYPFPGLRDYLDSIKFVEPPS